MTTENDLIFDYQYEQFKTEMDYADEPISVNEYMSENGIPLHTMKEIWELYLEEVSKRNKNAKN